VSALVLLAAGCDTRVADDGTGLSSGARDSSGLVIDSSAGLHSLVDPTTIVDASIDGNALTLELEFGGGCREHELALLWNGSFENASNSLPVSIALILRHDANDDPCDALLHETLEADLSPVAERYYRAYPDVLDLPIRIFVYGDRDRHVALSYSP
jgi:hypothetical protein